MKNLLAASALLFSATSWAECPEYTPWPDTQRPAIPQAQSATVQQMAVAGQTVSDYIERIENYLHCEPQRSMKRHNHLVELAANAAREYNRELRQFQLRDIRMVASH